MVHFFLETRPVFCFFLTEISDRCSLPPHTAPSDGEYMRGFNFLSPQSFLSSPLVTLLPAASPLSFGPAPPGSILHQRLPTPATPLVSTRCVSPSVRSLPPSLLLCRGAPSVRRQSFFASSYPLPSFHVAFLVPLSPFRCTKKPVVQFTAHL